MAGTVLDRDQLTYHTCSHCAYYLFIFFFYQCSIFQALDNQTGLKCCWQFVTRGENGTKCRSLLDVCPWLHLFMESISRWMDGWTSGWHPEQYARMTTHLHQEQIFPPFLFPQGKHCPMGHTWYSQWVPRSTKPQSTNNYVYSTFNKNIAIIFLKS